MFQNILCRPPTLLAQCLAGDGRLGGLPEQLGLRFRGRWRAPGGPCRTDVAEPTSLGSGAFAVGGTR